MIPLLLEIKGFNSFLEKQVIDFKEIVSKGVFGIFGPTGSGKSTILDAIIFALYGQLSRGSKDYINYLSKELYIKFVFRINNGNIKNDYSIVRIQNRKSINKVLLSSINNNSEEVLADGVRQFNKKIIEIIGLEREDFERTVILPQGRFGEFLSLRGKERNEALERIFNLSRYGKKLIDNLKIIKSKNISQLNQIEGSIKTLEDMGILKDLESLRSKIDFNKKIISENNIIIRENLEKTENTEKYSSIINELDTINKNILEKEGEFLIISEKYHSLISELDIVDKKYDKDYPKLLIKQSENSVIIEKCRKLEIIKNELSVYIEQKDRLNILLNEFEKTIKIDEKSKIDLNNKLLSLKKQSDILFIHPDIQEKIFNSMRDEEKIDSLKEEIKKFTKEIDKINSNINLNKENIDKNDVAKDKKELSILNEKLKKIISEIPDEEVLIDKKTKFNEMKNFLKENENISKKLSESFEIIKTVEQNLEITEKELKELNSRMNVEFIKNNEYIINIIKENINIFERCPICENKDLSHVSIKKGNTNDKHIDSKIIALIEEKNQYINEYKIKKNSFKEKIDLLLETENKYNKYNEEKKKLEQEVKILENNIKNFKINKSDLEKDILELEKSINSKEILKDNHFKDIERLNKDLQAIKENIEEKSNQLKFLENNLENQIKETGIKNFKEEYEKQKRNQKEFNDKRQEIEKVNKELEETNLKNIKFLEKVNHTEKEFSKLENNIENINKNLLKDFQDVKEINVQEILQDQDRIQKEIDLIINVREKLIKEREINKDIYDNLDISLKNIKNDKIRLTNILESLDQKKIVKEEIIEILIKENKEKNNRNSDLTEENGALKNEIILIENNKNKLKKLKEEKDGILNKKKNIDLISRLLSGKKFIEFICRKKLIYISMAASEILMNISSNKYSIELGADDSFVIVDYFNGGIKRPCNTLSGGEVFITSLSLALALSSHIQMKKSTFVEFFFLDEGFGTLDENLLDMVISTLEKLKENNLNIGIISHIEEIKNRVASKIVIQPPEYGVRGSRIISI